MSLKIIKAGLLDSIQDSGRYGAAHLGMGPGGAMDRFSAALANAILGKPVDTPVLELHFPAAVIELDAPAVFVLTGADFHARLNGMYIPTNQPVCINEKTVLQFEKVQKGSRCYLSLLNGLALRQWLNSYSTNFKAGAGGFQGRQLKAGDVIDYEKKISSRLKETIRLLPWHMPQTKEKTEDISFLPGPEWHWMSTVSQGRFLNTRFEISTASDRMGYRLIGGVPVQDLLPQLISSAVGFGTIQWLPNGEFIVLMADHPTTGGYPRIGQVITTDVGKLAQLNPRDYFSFSLTTRSEAEKQYREQQNFLSELQNTCKLNMQNFLDAAI